MRTDIATLKKTVDIVEVIETRLTLTKKGSEHYGICPFHDDHHKSLQVNYDKQVFSCFACGKSGDVIDFLVEMGATFKEAIAELLGEGQNDNKPVKVVRDRSKVVTWTMIAPKSKPGQVTHYKFGKPSKMWQYKDESGGMIGFICRFDTPDGKQVFPLTYCTDGQRSEWRWQGFKTPRPLYNLDQIKSRPEATILIVEGEKTADAAQGLLQHVVVTTWQGGARAIEKTDWTPIYGRKIVYWPDNDISQKYGSTHPKAGEIKPWYEQPGNQAMLEINDLLSPHCAVRKWIQNPEGTPDKWDVADAPEWTPEQAIQYVRSNLRSVPAKDEFKPEPKGPQKGPDLSVQDMTPEPSEPEYMPPPPDFGVYYDSPRPVDEDPFKILGFVKDGDATSYAFYQQRTKQVLILRASQLTSSNLVSLADLNWWIDNFPKQGKGKGVYDMDSATNWIMRTAEIKGYYSSKNLRGRGAWIDRGRVVIHAGDSLIVDGIRHDLGVLDTKFIYEAGEQMDFPTVDPLSAKEANKIIQITELMNWERPINAQLLAGWCVIAPICGALSWRPHIWVTGSAGTGKTWVFTEIVRRLLGANALSVQGETSEAGLRQTLRNDAMPVVFDEAEGMTMNDRRRMESVMSLMRAASSDDGGSMLKGSTNGSSPKATKIRSCFAFASIGVQVTHQADRGRVSILGLRKATDEGRQERWQRLQKLYTETITADFIASLQARTVSLLPIILRNAKVFAGAAAAELNEQRQGDQLGALLAGAYSLYSSGLIDFDAAVEFVRRHDWSEERSYDSSRDEYQLFSTLMDQLTRVDGINATPVERTIGELILRALGETLDESVGMDVAKARLKRLGISCDREWIYISNSHGGVMKLLKDTAWSKNHSKTLLRIEGAEQAQSCRFGPGSVTRAVKIPMRTLQK